jgi:uncharacterized protein YdeI (YjbR/CyaY-like superfamily)
VAGLKTSQTVEARTLEEWRHWLVRHHESESEVWLVFHKRHTRRESVAYTDALDEALCFGWIDSLVKRLDEHRYARKFTPRTPDSRWSSINRRRYRQLRASGRLTPAGARRAPTGRTGDAPMPRRAPLRVPPYIRKALRSHAAARRTFERLAPSYRRRYVGWIDSARRPETKAKRLREALALLAAGRKLGLK